MRVLLTAKERHDLFGNVAIAAVAFAQIFDVLRAINGRLGLEREPHGEALAVRDIVDEYSADTKPLTEHNVGDDFAMLEAWTAPDSMHINIESTAQGGYVLVANAEVLTAPFPTREAAEQGLRVLQPFGRRA